MSDGLGAQRLSGCHHVLLLRKESVAELLCPVELLAHHRQNLRERRQRLDRRIPGLLLQRVLERLTFQVGIRLHPSLGDHDLERVRRRHQHLGQQGVRIQRDRCDQLVELLLKNDLVAADAAALGDAAGPDGGVWPGTGITTVRHSALAIIDPRPLIKCPQFNRAVQNDMMQQAERNAQCAVQVCIRTVLAVCDR